MPLVATPTIALLGNPNTGKTTLFNALSGLRQRVGNYPGVTVETKKGQYQHAGVPVTVVDLPGTYSLAARSPDEMVAVDLVLGHQAGEPRPDVVVTIVDASNLERNLYLTTQALELGVPVVVALNMIDVAESQGLKIDTQRLSRQLGVPVVPVQANQSKGLRELKEAIDRAVGGTPPPNHPTFPEAFEREVAELGRALGEGVEPFLVRRLLLDVGGYTEERLSREHGDLRERVRAARQRLSAACCPVPAIEARTRYTWIRAATEGCVTRPSERPVSWTDRLDRVLTHKIWGSLLFLAVMFLVFQSIFIWAKPLMDGIKAGQDWLGDTVGEPLSPGPLRSLLVNGVIKGVGSILVFLPQILLLFAFIAVLEDCGYMARAAFLMDKLMSRCGLSGKSFIPLLSSIACAVPGIMGARVIEDRRDRLATILVAPLMSCSARLPVYILLISAFLSDPEVYSWWVPGLTMFAMYLVGIVVAPLVALALKRTLLRGQTPVFVMEMPLYKRPSLRTILHRMFEAGWMFVRRAGTLILATMIVIWAMLYFPSTIPGTNQSFDVEIAKLEDDLKEQIDREKYEKSLEKWKEEIASGTLPPERKKSAEEAAAMMSQTLENWDEYVKKEQEKQEPAIKEARGAWSRQSLLGQLGQLIEPVVQPLGWDWRIGMAALASFPAREVFVGTMGLIYSQGEGDVAEKSYRDDLGGALNQARWDSDPSRPVYTVPVALSIMVFFALCCQCVSTLAVIRRETNSWAWPIFTFVYMTVLAYVAALVTYQVGRLLV